MKNKTNKHNEYDVIVVGGGHAGCEAALACARLNCKTLLLTINIDTIGLMPCNPAIGGPAKGQMVSEMDALGGQMGIAADATSIQMKVLNRSKGPAVQCLRSQNDKLVYQKFMKQIILFQKNLDTKQALVTEIIVKNNKVCGVITELQEKFFAKCVVITGGTFLKGKIHIGLKSFAAGRLGELPSNELSDSLKKHLILNRLKTGTTPRIDSRSIDYTQMLKQSGDSEFLTFSFKTSKNNNYKNQVDCYLTNTNEKTHQIIRDNLDRSPLYQKIIKGVGPRYCPSIEDKIMRFYEKKSHQVFVEPEGRDTTEVYLQGLNTSLPEDVQIKFVRSIKGLEKAEIIKYGYAVEYDYILPSQLQVTLETQKIKNLFFAGQIVGTSGYEEAACLGLVAGINAARSAKKLSLLILKRADGYIGTLIDDLITKAIHEPYRMMTSRSEYRLLFRQDNAIFRLSTLGYKMGLISNDEYNNIEALRESVKAKISFWKKEKIALSTLKNYKIFKPMAMFNFIKRSEIDYPDLIKNSIISKSDFISKSAFIDIKYEGYINRLTKEISNHQKIENKKIPANFNFDIVLGIKTESRDKLKKIRPKTIKDAKKIAGVNPADINIILLYLNRKRVIPKSTKK